MIRDGRDTDAQGFIALIDGCWQEYPGCIMDLDGEVPELRALATHCAAKGGRLWAAEDAAGAIVGMVATYPLNADQAWEVARMYVARQARGTGLCRTLAVVCENGATTLLRAFRRGSCTAGARADWRSERPRSTTTA